ncbi:replication protein A 70 kDa DNA-binding subunit B [Tanacetum coccineum]
MVNKALRLSFLSSTKVEPCPDFSGSFYGFNFRGYIFITDLQQEEDGQFDLNMYDKNGKSSKKKPLTLVDHELFAREDVEKSGNTTTRICTNSKNSTKETFVGVTLVIMGTIIAIHEEEGWWYIGYRSCKKKVIREKEIIDLETDMPKKSSSGKDNWWCIKCNVVPTKTMFRFQDHVQDKTGTMSLTLWNDEVQAVVDISAYQLCEKYAKYAFKVSIDEYNVKKLLLVFTVLRLSDDPEILASIRLSVTPTKDLESQTDENTTPVSTQKNNVVDHAEQQHASDGKNKRVAKNDIGNESSNGKKKAIEVKTEKYA